MPIKLFDYQHTGVKWLSERKTALLADEQRLGKSVQAIKAIEAINAKKILIICKAVARTNWKFEFEKVSEYPWNFEVLFGTRFGPVIPKEGTVWVCSYEAAGIVLENLKGDFDVVVVDESHSIKNLEAKRTQIILGKNGICRKTKRIWLLTGTPAPNNASELWPVLYTFGATKLKFREFVDKFCTTRDSGFGLQITGTKLDKPTITELRSILKKVMLRRTGAEVSIQLPKIHFSTVMVPPGRVDLAFSVSLQKYIFPVDRTDELNEIIKKETGIIKAILKDKTISHDFLAVLKAQAKSISTLRHYTAMQKLEPAIELIREELEAGAYRKCVIFAHHAALIKGAQIRLQDYGAVVLYGGSNPRTVERHLKNFQNPNHKTRVFIGNILAAGTSISLSAANHIFFLEQDWVPGNNAQAMMRCGGVNQKNPIFVRNFCLDDPIDKRITELLRKKTMEIAEIYNDPKIEKLNDLL